MRYLKYKGFSHFQDCLSAFSTCFDLWLVDRLSPRGRFCERDRRRLPTFSATMAPVNPMAKSAAGLSVYIASDYP